MVRAGQVRNSRWDEELRQMLPHYIHPVGDYLDDSDIRYMAHTEVFQFPEWAICDAILRSYVYYVYPYLPSLDVHHLLEAFKRDSPSRISLLLFHAISCASFHYVNIDIILAGGYSSRSEAIDTSYKKSRVSLQIQRH